MYGLCAAVTAIICFSSEALDGVIMVVTMRFCFDTAIYTILTAEIEPSRCRYETCGLFREL